MRKFISVSSKIALYVLLFGAFLALPLIFWMERFHGGASDASLTPVERIPLEAMSALAALLAAFLLCKAFKGPKFDEFGLLKTVSALHALSGALLGFAMIAIVLAALWAGGLASVDIRAAFPTGLILGATALGLFLNTVFQEVMFRGFIFRAILQHYSIVTSIIVSSVLFVAIHGAIIGEPWPMAGIGLLNLFAAGIMLSLAYLRTKSLWLPIGLHFGWNFAQASLGLAVTGQVIQDRQSLFAINGAPIITGGPFGIEGGLAGLLGPVAGLVLVLVLFRDTGAKRQSTFDGRN